MKKITFFLTLLSISSLLGMWGCTGDVEENFEETASLQTFDAVEIVSLENAFYHEVTGSWISPRKDPYALENFKQALSNLVSGKSAQTLEKNVVSELSRFVLKPTHYTVKLFPKTVDEQAELEVMDGIPISYFPFDYVQLPEESTKKLQKAEAKNTFSKEVRYTELFDDFESSEGGLIEPFTIELPVLYAVWPCDKPFPSDLDYELMYEVFLPVTESDENFSVSKFSVINLLEREARNIASDGPYISKSSSWDCSTARGSVFHKDLTHRVEAPMINLKIRYQLGSQIWDTYTDASGNYWIGNCIPANATVSFIFGHEKWKLTTDNSTSAYTITWGTHISNYQKKWMPVSSLPIFETHRAVNFYHHGSHTVPKWTYSSGIRVIVLSYEASFNGRFNYSTNKNAYIEISNVNWDRPGRIIGTTLHEFGHWAQYCMKGSYSSYNNCTKLIKESWASYCGWYMGELYYNTLGWRQTANPPDDITGQSRQGWDRYSNEYSPIFVDLRDDYNQPTLYDAIKNVPFTVINDLGVRASNWNNFRSLIVSHLSDSYSNLILNLFFLPFDQYIPPHSVNITPNPVTNQELNVKVGAQIYGNGTMKIYNSAGRLVLTDYYVGLAPYDVWTVSVRGLSGGSYSLTLDFTGNTSFAGGRATANFVKP